MVVFVDLDSDDFTENLGSTLSLENPFPFKLMVAPNATAKSIDLSSLSTVLDDSHNATHTQSESPTIYIPNRNAFSACLSCYPYRLTSIVKEIARSVDLNTLHALASTCRQFQANLTQFRHQLVRETLRCENEYPIIGDDLFAEGTMNAGEDTHVSRSIGRGGRTETGRLTRGQVRACARDMVDECRRCSMIICRNCTAKPPSQTALERRIRRICQTCRTAPISSHIHCIPDKDFSAIDQGIQHIIAATISQNICTCENVVWLCNGCGQTHSDDTIYRRIWTWRERYSTSLGEGLGTGIGVGSEGLKCGRGEGCLTAQEVEVDTDISTLTVSDHDEPGYFRQETVGLGGKLKQKAKHRYLVGACVPEYEDELTDFLKREKSGEHRAWCAWCKRLILAKKELNL
ncbi:hypothetical protein N7495_006584 [Penicillium taxi]|uniref:uncharacterized protein n=1 Tax=Penicillium taxi TaxID=168475 RepID=UPI002544D7AB|nr:uncharacterized protein N7495_006584 [Penicillium taxi]KAJ5894893.1 hypothetical protein N7495_006584 [Penicillium taxi]